MRLSVGDGIQESSSKTGGLTCPTRAEDDNALTVAFTGVQCL